MLVIAVVALIMFGPRKLPEIGRTVGKSLAEFKRASEDFKRTWEREVEIDRIESDLRADVEGAGKTPALGADATDGTGGAAVAVPAADEDAWGERTIARGGAFEHTETSEFDDAPVGGDGQATADAPPKSPAQNTGVDAPAPAGDGDGDGAFILGLSARLRLT